MEQENKVGTEIRDSGTEKKIEISSNKISIFKFLLQMEIVSESFSSEFLMHDHS